MFNNQYFSAQYFPPQYHTLLGGTQIQEGRSGYYRLFFHQLQEQALETNRPKAEPIKKPEVFAPVKVLKDGSAVVELPIKPKAKVAPKQVEETAKSPPFRQFVKTPLRGEEAKSYIAETMLIHQQVQMLFSEWNISGIIRKQLEDEIEDEDLLLLSTF